MTDTFKNDLKFYNFINIAFPPFYRVCVIYIYKYKYITTTTHLLYELDDNNFFSFKYFLPFNDFENFLLLKNLHLKGAMPM